MNRRQQVLLVLSIAISALFLLLAFRGLSPAQAWESIRTAQFGWLIVGFFVYYGALLVISRRWKFLIDVFTPVPVIHLFQLNAIGYMGNNIYPFRAGEVLRCVLLRRSHHVPLAKSGMTVFIERAFDGIVMVTFLLVGLSVLDLNSEVLRGMAAFTLPWFVGSLTIFLLLAQRPQTFKRIIHAVTGRLPTVIGKRLAALSDDMIGGFEGMRRIQDLIGTLATSYLSWMIEAFVYACVGMAFGLPFNYLLILVVVAAVNLGQIIPTSPGGLGVFEFFAKTVLMAAGVAEAQALGYAILVHIIIWLPPTLLGFFMLWRQGLKLSAVAHARELETVESTNGV